MSQNTVKTARDGSFRDFEKVSQGWPNLLRFVLRAATALSVLTLSAALFMSPPPAFAAGKKTNSGGEGGLLDLHDGRTIKASATRGIDEQINLGGEGGLLALHDGRKVKASASRGMDEAINLGGEGGLLALNDGRTIKASATRSMDEQVNLGGEGGLLALHDGRKVKASASRKVDEELNLGGEGGLLNLNDGRTVKATASRDVDEQVNLGGEAGLLALPDGKTITVTVSREKGKTTEKAEEKGLLVLPDGRTISATVTREKEKKARLIAKRIKPSTDIDLTGCWGGPPEMSIVQSGQQVVATIVELRENNKKVEMVYKGTYNPPVLNLAHRYTWDTLRTGSGRSGGEKSDRILLAAGLERRYRFRLYKNSHPLAPHGLVLSGKWLPVSHIIGFTDDFDQPYYAQPNNIWLSNVSLIKTNTTSLNIESIIITKSDFKTGLGKIASDDPFWIKATASSGCSKVPDSFEVTVFFENDPATKAHVMLKETGPNTLEFRSPAKGLTLSNLLRKDKEKDKAKKTVAAKPAKKTGIKPKKDTGIFEPETFKIPEFEFSAPQFGTENAPEMEETKMPSKTHKEAATPKSKKTKKSGAKKEKKAISGSKEKQEIIEVGAQGGKKKAGFRTALNRNKGQLIAEKKWLKKELKNRKKTLNNLGKAKSLFIRHYINNNGKKIARLETTDNPELSGQEFKLEKTDSVLFMRKAKEHLNREIGRIETDIKRIMKELKGLR